MALGISFVAMYQETDYPTRNILSTIGMALAPIEKLSTESSFGTSKPVTIFLVLNKTNNEEELQIIEELMTRHDGQKVGEGFNREIYKFLVLPDTDN